MKRILLFVIFWLAAVSLYADYLRVSRKAAIKAESNSSSRTLVSVDEDTLLELVNNGEQVNGYYAVRGNNFSGTGWIYKTFARRYYGDMPEPVTKDDLTDNPLRDATHKLTEQERTYASKHLKLGK